MKLYPRTCRPLQSLSQGRGRTLLLSVLLLALTAASGCASSRSNAASADDSLSPQAARLAKLTTAEAAEATRGLLPAERFDAIDASCPVPDGWVLQPMKEGKNHKHLTWISPTGKTAYGVIFASLPFPAAIVPTSYRLDRVFDGFMSEMKRREGRSELFERRNDYRNGLVYFVAEGSQYRLRVNLLTHGGRAWFVYAGTRRGETAEEHELDLAERARDLTEVGGK